MNGEAWATAVGALVSALAAVISLLQARAAKGQVAEARGQVEAARRQAVAAEEQVAEARRQAEAAHRQAEISERQLGLMTQQAQAIDRHKNDERKQEHKLLARRLLRAWEALADQHSELVDLVISSISRGSEITEYRNAVMSDAIARRSDELAGVVAELRVKLPDHAFTKEFDRRRSLWDKGVQEKFARLDGMKPRDTLPIWAEIKGMHGSVGKLVDDLYRQLDQWSWD